MDRIVYFKNVSFQYKIENGEMIEALKEIELEFNSGDFISIIGPNGSGKSSLAKHINALLQPAQGTVLVLGMDTKDLERVWEIRQHAGMVFQNPENQMIATTVEDDMAFGLENLGIEPKEIKRRIDLALEQVDMEESRHLEPHRLSGGQKQRVAVAGILAMRPSMIIFDEATSMLDPKGRREVKEVVHRLNKEEKITVINITHSLEETLGSDRIVVMNRGRVEMTGSPLEIFKQSRQLKDMGLDLPFFVELKSRLQTEGFAVADEVLNPNDLVEEIWKSL